MLLAHEGAKVVVNDLGGGPIGGGADDRVAAQVAEEIRAAGGEAVANYDNVATMEGGARIIQTALDSFGRLDHSHQQRRHRAPAHHPRYE